MQKIIPHLWFDKEAKDAAAFYISVFPDSKITSSTVLKNTPSGDCDVLAFELSGMKFEAISAGPYFKINPSVSFMVNFDPSQNPDAEKHLNETWEKLIDGGKALMPIDTYPFSRRYGWVQDKFGVTWQLILTNPEGESRPFIMPSLMFANELFGKAEEATNYYMEVFKDSKRGTLARYSEGMAPGAEGKIMFTDYMLENQWFTAIDAPGKHEFGFSEAISLIVKCDTQKEIDYYWNKLSHVPESEQCGWCKDQYGLSWQIVPKIMDQMMTGGDEEKIIHVTEAFMKMKKFDISALEEAYNK